MEINKKRTEEPSYSVWQNIKFMISLAWRERRSLLWLCLAMVVVALMLSLVQLFITPSILHAIEVAVPVNKLISIIVLFAGALMMLSAANSYLITCTEFMMTAVRLYMAQLIQNKVLTMSYPNIENQDVRKKIDKAFMLIGSIKASTQLIWSTLTDLLKNIFGFAIYLTLLATLNPLLIVAVLLTTAASFFISNHLNDWGYRHRDEESEYSRRMNYISEKSRDYTLAKDVRIFGMRGWMEDMYASTLQLIQSFAARGERVYIMGNVADVLFTFMRNGIVYMFLIDGVLQGEMSAAQFVLYFNTVGVFTSGIGGILGGFSELRKQSFDISAIREFIDYPEPFLLEGGAPLTPDLNTYQIELRNVSFRYPESNSNTLSHVNLTIHVGEKLAIVGLNGAGKTTLIKLICGFLNPTEGEVLLNNTNIKTYNRRDYYLLFSAVFQDFSILDVTIAENITQTDGDINIEWMEHCAKQAGISGKINSLPNGFSTHLGRVFEDGVELSGGEVQRLMLARALYKNAPIIVLDEPTAALDPIAESEIYTKYNELTNGRTSLYISHRLASTRFCDRIILLAGGSIVEEGTHETLITKAGRYAELFEIQSQYYREGVMEDE